ncbi:hypothetical protein Tco_1415075, partial [Tanacetum coccineum]
GSYALPSNFEEVATGVLKVLNNLALIDIHFIQMMLVSKAGPKNGIFSFDELSSFSLHQPASEEFATEHVIVLRPSNLKSLNHWAQS